MKIIKYQFMTEVNHGTEEQPDIHQIFSDVTMGWNEANEELAKREACNGEYTIEDVPDDRPLDEIRADKLAELSASCSDAITAGMDVETTQGTEHFSLQETDQINLTTALSAIQNGSVSYPYHADGQLCRLFSAKEIQDIAEASIKHKLYHTTLCNHLMTWVRRTKDKKELADIKYSIENLPQDLKQNMMDILEKTVYLLS